MMYLKNMQKFDHRQGVKNVVIALHFNKCSGGGIMYLKTCRNLSKGSEGAPNRYESKEAYLSQVALIK